MGVKVLRCKICNLTHQHNLLSEKYTALPQAWRKRLDSFTDLDVEFESSFSRFFFSSVMSEKEKDLPYLSTAEDGSLKNIVILLYFIILQHLKKSC